MPKTENWFNQDLKKPIKVRALTSDVFTLDNVGSLIGVRVFDNGEPVTLTGTVNGYCIIPNGETVPIAGTRSENTAYIALTQSALAYPGPIRISIKLTNDSEITTLLAVVATVCENITGTVITPSQQAITDWSQQIAAEMQAVEDASAAQDAKITDLKSASVKYVQNIADGTDLNNLYENGYYFHTAFSNKYTNNPEGANATGVRTVIVMGFSPNESTVTNKRMFYINHSTNYIAMRFMNGGSWGDWKRIATSDDITRLDNSLVGHDKVIKETLTSMLSGNYSYNLLNTDAITGDSTIDVNGNISSSSGKKVTDFIPVNPLDEITILYQGSTRITTLNFYVVCAYDINKSAISAKGTTTRASTYIVPDGIRYIRVCYPGAATDVMFLANIWKTFPSAFINYKEPYFTEMGNPLFGKKVVFDGDSICHGNSANDDALVSTLGGWAKRIGTRNNMEWHNEAVAGATIATNTYNGNPPDTEDPRHWISSNIDAIYAAHPDADYIIFEGGTNDADRYRQVGEAAPGTFDPTDYTGPFDDTTFYGAMDSLCKKALAYFPKAQIGFIIAQKMGTANGSNVRGRRAYFDYAKRVCKKWGIPVLDLWECGQLRPDISTMYDSTYNTIQTATEHGLMYYDGQHLTKYGYDVIVPKVEAWMRSMTSDARETNIPEPPASNGSYVLKCAVSNGVTTYSWELTS